MSTLVFVTEEGKIPFNECVVVMGNDRHHRMLNKDHTYGGKSSYMAGDGTTTTKGRELVCNTCGHTKPFTPFLLALKHKDYDGKTVSVTKDRIRPPRIALDCYETEEYPAINGDTFRVTYWGKASDGPIIIKVVYTIKPFASEKPKIDESKDVIETPESKEALKR